MWGKPPPPVAPDACSPAITAAIPPTPKVPDGAGIPLPVTAEERAAMELYLLFLGDLSDHDRALVARFVEAQGKCG